MTRTNVMASSRPQTADAATTRSGSSRARRGLLILPVVLALGLAPAAPALAVEGTSTGTYTTPPPTADDTNDDHAGDNDTGDDDTSDDHTGDNHAVTGQRHVAVEIDEGSGTDDAG